MKGWQGKNGDKEQQTLEDDIEEEEACVVCRTQAGVHVGAAV